eukprot:3608039-Pleurochrysis_carterae.AAC.1
MYGDAAAASGHLQHSAAGRGHCAPYSERHGQMSSPPTRRGRPPRRRSVLSKVIGRLWQSSKPLTRSAGIRQTR